MASASHGDSSDNLPHVKLAKVNRYVKRENKQKAFASLDTDEMLKYVEEKQEQKTMRKKKRHNDKNGPKKRVDDGSSIMANGIGRSGSTNNDG